MANVRNLVNISIPKDLTKDSSFELIAQFLIKTIYHTHYTSQAAVKPIIHKKISRFLHGGLHVSSAALLIQEVKRLIRKHLPHMQKSLLASIDEDPEMLKLLLLGAISHDIANTSECFSREEDHAIVFEAIMKKIGFMVTKVETIANALKNKDNNDIRKDIFTILIGDADRYEYLRTLKLEEYDQFEQSRLEIFQLFSNELKNETELNNALEDINISLQLQHRRANFLNFCMPVHEQIEFSTNCYLETELYFKSFGVWSRFTIEYNLGGMCYPTYDAFTLKSQIMENSLPVDEIFNDEIIGEASKFIKANYLKKCQSYNSDDNIKCQKTADDWCDKTGEAYVRMLVLKPFKTAPIMSEINQIETNNCILLKNNIKNCADLKIKFEEAYKQNNLSALPGLLFSPSMLYKKGIPMENFYPHGVGFIINPETAKAVYFYKSDAKSYTLSNFGFNLEKNNNKKELGSLKKLSDKMIEMDRRRRGSIPDNSLHYFGHALNPYSEVLLIYNFPDIKGIIVSHRKDSARSALLLKLQLLEHNIAVSFYTFNSYHGFERISEYLVMTWALLMPADKYSIKMNLPYEFLQKHQVNLSPCLSMENFSITGMKKEEKLENKSIQVEFTYRNGVDEVCKAKTYMLEGNPIIEMEEKNNIIKYYDQHQTFFKVHRLHVANSFNALNKLYKNFSLFFKIALGITDLTFSHYSTPYDIIHKQKLIGKLSYTDRNRRLSPNQLLKFLGYTHPLKSFDVLNDCDVVKITLRSHDIINLFPAMLENLKYEILNWREKCVGNVVPPFLKSKNELFNLIFVNKDPNITFDLASIIINIPEFNGISDEEEIDWTFSSDDEISISNSIR